MPLVSPRHTTGPWMSSSPRCGQNTAQRPPQREAPGLFDNPEGEPPRQQIPTPTPTTDLPREEEKR